MAFTRCFWRKVAASFLTLGLLQPLTFGSPSQTEDIKSKQIEVRLVPKKKTVRIGGTLEVRVEIWNVGSKPLFIYKDIYELCSRSPLSLRLELGPRMKPRPGHGCASDCVYGRDDSFARRLVFFWTTLSPGDFYGTVVSMDPDTFPQLDTPGRWRLSGSYKSVGDLSSGFCFDPTPLPDTKEQINKLPYEAWHGEVDTNSVWIEVVRAGSSPATKKR